MHFPFPERSLILQVKRQALAVFQHGKRGIFQ
jgi:hypothetical protein